MLFIILILLILSIYNLRYYSQEKYSSNLNSNHKIINLVLYSNVDKDVKYEEMYNISKEFYKNFKNIKTYYYCYSKEYKLPTIIDDMLYIPGEETIVPGITNKTLDAMEYLYSSEIKFDYIVRTNISSIIRFDILSDKLARKSIEYGGSLSTLNWLDPPRGIVDNTHFGVTYAWGICIIMSRLFVENCIKYKKDIMDLNIIDDVSLGIFHKKMYKTKPAEFEAVVFDKGLVDEKDITPEMYIFRHKNLDRSQDVYNMKITCQVLTDFIKQ